jgi:hypothetical protein
MTSKKKRHVRVISRRERLIRDRAERMGYRLMRDEPSSWEWGTDYFLVVDASTDSVVSSRSLDLDEVEEFLDVREKRDP